MFGSGSGGGPALPELARRMRVVVGVVATGLIILVGRLWQLQGMNGDSYYKRARDNVVHERFLPSIRGKIVDRHGVPLARNRPAFNLYVTPATYAAAAPELRRLLGLTDEEVRTIVERVTTGGKREIKTPVLALEDQGRDRAALVEQAKSHLPGVEIRNEPYRDYPQGDLAAQVVGYMSKLTAKELDDRAKDGYDANDLIGHDGIEQRFEDYLRGKKGRERFAVDARGQRIDDALTEDILQGDRGNEPVAGSDVVLTLDVALQQVAEKAVAPFAAAAVAVVEVKTGRVIALVSKPSYDPNIMTGHLTAAEWDLLNSDPRSPLIDKTIRATYPPGSIFKFVTAIAALEDGQVTEDEKITCNGEYELSGTKFDCTAAHGTLDLLGAIQHSCNVYFWHLAERVGMDRMSVVAGEYGLGRPTGLGIHAGGDAGGRVPTKAWYEGRGAYRVGYATNAATGQGDVEVTVLQMAMAYAALGNGGILYEPQIVRRVVDGDGKESLTYPPRVSAVVATPPWVVDVWKRGMWKVVNEPGGTAFGYATSALVTIAGKTGTAEVKSKSRRERLEERGMEGWHPTNAHAWFAGWAPADDPEIAIVVFIEHGGSGGKIAGPVAKTIVEAWAKARTGTGAGASP